ncbi:hypothetical protein K443DRAFT_189952 [Laccaria amethystina LaAM-08-1]|uniref:Uncharacterized protein n=1 Tax=Laccaria amethystina LaAM-08-1 TaxID=1095629 RepID=A0A0C9WNE5_9AGAR|nr:hypothetical protein K443DRAFT_189952 [Laccaria amethystina LaAM-08-1]
MSEWIHFESTIPFLVCSSVHPLTGVEYSSMAHSGLLAGSGLQRHYHPTQLDGPPGSPHTSPQSRTSRLNGTEPVLDLSHDLSAVCRPAFVRYHHIPSAHPAQPTIASPLLSRNLQSVLTIRASRHLGVLSQSVGC